MGLRIYGKGIKLIKKTAVVVITGAACLVASSHEAQAAKKVYSPIVEQGELEIESTGTYDFDHKKDKNSVQEYKNAVGYGVTDRWATELYGEFERESEEDEDGNTKLSRMKFTNVEWENRYQLTEQGQFWVDAGLYFEYEIPLRQKEPGEIEGKILLEKSLQNFTHTSNIIFKKEVGGGSQAETEGGFAWSSRYRLSAYFQPGLEYWIDFGEINKHLPYNEQSHQLGPVFYGKIGHVKYDLGYLFGISDAAPRVELKWIAEYEFRF